MDRTDSGNLQRGWGQNILCLINARITLLSFTPSLLEKLHAEAFMQVVPQRAQRVVTLGGAIVQLYSFSSRESNYVIPLVAEDLRFRLGIPEPRDV
jgi:hypothetical protein